MNERFIACRILAEGAWRDGDQFFLLTDAITNWFLRQYESGGRPWDVLAQADELSLRSLVQRSRANRQMRDDDVTIVDLSFVYSDVVSLAATSPQAAAGAIDPVTARRSLASDRSAEFISFAASQKATALTPERFDPRQINTPGEFAAALRGLRANAGLTLRHTARQLNLQSDDTPTYTTLADWFNGSRLPAPRLEGAIPPLLTLCGESDSAEIAEWMAALRRARRVLPPRHSARSGGQASAAGHVFICYAREDAANVSKIQQRFEAAGIRVWRDTADLWPGEDWRTEIRKAIADNALVFLACFSRASVARKVSYQNEELSLAIDQMRMRKPGDPWLIPVRFDDCEIPEITIGPERRLSSIQRADLFSEFLPEGTKSATRARRANIAAIKPFAFGA